MKKIKNNRNNSEDTITDYNRTTTVDKLILKADINSNIFTCTKLSQNISIREVTKVEAMKINSYYGKNHRYCFLVNYKETHSATIFYNDKNNANRNCTIIFKNHTFYTEFSKILLELVTNKILPLKQIYIQELDIAMDINKCILKRTHKVYALYREDKLYIKGKAIFKEEVPKGSYYIGAKKYINIYDKLKELKNSNKQYITDYFQQNDFNLQNGVSRIELRLSRNKGGFIAKLINNIKVEELCNTTYLNSVISKICADKLIIVHNDNKYSNRKTKETFFDIDFTTNVKQVFFADTIPDDKANIKTVHSYIKKLHFDWVIQSKCNPQSDLYLVIERHIINFKQKPWYYKYIDSSKYKREFDNYESKYCNFTHRK